MQLITKTNNQRQAAYSYTHTHKHTGKQIQDVLCIGLLGKQQASCNNIVFNNFEFNDISMEMPIHIIIILIIITDYYCVLNIEFWKLFVCRLTLTIAKRLRRAESCSIRRWLLAFWAIRPCFATTRPIFIYKTQMSPNGIL